MATVSINSQEYEVHEDVAEQFSKFIRRSKAKDAEIEAGLDREEGMCLAIKHLQQRLYGVTHESSTE
jgi:hypothetical protein